MKAAVYTAIFGNYDPLHYAVRQSVPTAFYAILDSAKKPQGWQQVITSRRFSDPRMDAKWFKVFPDKLEFAEDYVIWIDGSIRITSPEFVAYMIDQAGDTMAAFQHPWRTCIYQEAGECWDMVKYQDQPIWLRSSTIGIKGGRRMQVLLLAGCYVGSEVTSIPRLIKTGGSR